MADVFISYHDKTSGDLVSRIAYVLNDHGISCWYAKRDLPVGGDFADYIPSQIEQCKVFLLILDIEAMRSKHVENELGLAFSRYNKQKNITIIPYRIDDCTFSEWMKYYLIHIQIKNFPQNFREMINQVAQALGKSAEFRYSSGKQSKNNQEKSNDLVIESHGKCGKKTEWFFMKSNSLLFFTGSGEITYKRQQVLFSDIFSDYFLRYDYEAQYTHQIGIDHGITKIGNYAFEDFTQLEKILIPDSVISIGHSAFRGCVKLKSVEIPSSVINIGWFAFHNCTSLTSIEIPDSISQIKPATFAECTRLSTVTFPECISNIWPFAFYHCPRLKRILVPKNTKIWPFAFDHNVFIERV